MQEELRAVAESLAARLHRSVAIDDPHIRLLVHTAHAEDVDPDRVQSILQRKGGDEIVSHVLSHGIATAEGPVRIPGLRDRGVLGRVCVPVRCDGRLFGYLWLIDDDQSLTPADLQLATEAAASAGQLLHREHLIGSLRESRDRELLRDLLSEDASVRSHAARDLVERDIFPEHGQVVLVGVRIDEAVVAATPSASTELDLALRRAVLHLTPVRALAVSRSGGHGHLLIAGSRIPTPGAVRSHAQDLHATLAKSLGSGDLRIGIGPTVESLAEAHQSYTGASDVLRVAEVVPGFGPVVSYDELGIYGLLARLPTDELPGDAVPAGLRELIAKDGSGHLVETLETYLDQAGDAQASLALLHIQRSSLYYRLARIEKVTGMSLSAGGDRLALHLGLKLARLIGVLPAAD